MFALLNVIQEDCAGHFFAKEKNFWFTKSNHQVHFKNLKNLEKWVIKNEQNWFFNPLDVIEPFYLCLPSCEMTVVLRYEPYPANYHKI